MPNAVVERYNGRGIVPVQRIIAAESERSDFALFVEFVARFEHDARVHVEFVSIRPAAALALVHLVVNQEPTPQGTSRVSGE